MPDHNSTPSVIDDDVELRNSLGQQRSPVRVITLRSRLYEFHDVTFDSAKMNNKQTVHDATYDLLRSLGLTTVFGNPGSTEQTFLQRFPDDFTYVLALQEASALAMADGFAQSTGKPALVNVHTAAGTGNAMGNLVAAYRANTPLIVTAGQQTREMVLCDPYLTNRDETLMPLPWV